MQVHPSALLYFESIPSSSSSFSCSYSYSLILLYPLFLSLSFYDRWMLVPPSSCWLDPFHVCVCLYKEKESMPSLSLSLLFFLTGWRSLNILPHSYYFCYQLVTYFLPAEPQTAARSEICFYWILTLPEDCASQILPQRELIIEYKKDIDAFLFTGWFMPALTYSSFFCRFSVSLK